MLLHNNGAELDSLYLYKDWKCRRGIDQLNANETRNASFVGLEIPQFAYRRANVHDLFYYIAVDDPYTFRLCLRCLSISEFNDALETLLLRAVRIPSDVTRVTLEKLDDSEEKSRSRDFPLETVSTRRPNFRELARLIIISIYSFDNQIYVSPER